MTVYQAANVYALTSATHPADRATSLAYLRQALREGYRDFATAETDPDMAAVRDLSEYKDAVRSARELAR
jgi:hypothetical protein